MEMALMTSKYVRFCWLAVLLWGMAQLGLAQTLSPPGEFPVRVAIHLVDEQTGKSIPYASVYNFKTQKGFSADSSGFFTTVISAKDTLRITCIGYYEKLYVKEPYRTNNYYAVVTMKSKLLELAPVTIFAPRLEKVNTILVKPEYLRKDEPRLWLFAEPGGEPASPTIMNPISFIYELYSRQGRDRRKIRDILMEKEFRERLNRRYSPALVNRYTGLDEDELEAFMRFCSMPEMFILQATEYEIAERIFRCFENFKEARY